MNSLRDSTPSLYDKIHSLQVQKKSERGSVSFQNSTGKTLSTKGDSLPRKSKLFLTKKFVKSITPFMKSLRNIKAEKALEKPSNSDIFHYSLRKYLKEEIDIDELMFAKNFPNKYWEQKKDQLKNIPKHGVEPGAENRQKIMKLKTMNLAKQTQKNNIMKKFGLLWKSIKERIDYRKKVKSELEKLNPYYLISTSDAKFFANFYFATNEHIDKILNKDLNSSSNRKFFTNRDLKSLQLKEMLLKRPKMPNNRSVHNQTEPAKNDLCSSFFKGNAELFLKNIENEENELESFKAKTKGKRKITGYLSNERNNQRKPAGNRLGIRSFWKDIKLENSNLIVSELNGAEGPNQSDATDSSLLRRNARNKIDMRHESFKEAKERMLYDRKLTQYLHKKPNIYRILHKYTTEVSPIITEIHNFDNFNDKNMIDAISNSENLDFLRNKFDKFHPKTSGKTHKKENNYFLIKRNNKTTKEVQSGHDANQDASCDSDNQSLTEATLDNLYKESMNIQKRILEKKNDGVGKRLKQFIKLANISQ